jgi:hypothetical protein
MAPKLSESPCSRSTPASRLKRCGPHAPLRSTQRLATPAHSRRRSTGSASEHSPRAQGDDLCLLADTLNKHPDGPAALALELSRGSVALNLTVFGWYTDADLGPIAAATLLAERQHYLARARDGRLPLDQFDVLVLFARTDSGSIATAMPPLEDLAGSSLVAAFNQPVVDPLSGAPAP